MKDSEMHSKPWDSNQITREYFDSLLVEMGISMLFYLQQNLNCMERHLIHLL